MDHIVEGFSDYIQLLDESILEHLAFKALTCGIHFSFRSNRKPRSLANDSILISKLCKLNGDKFGIGFHLKKGV